MNKRFILTAFIMACFGISTVYAQRIVSMSPNQEVDSVKFNIYDVARYRVFYKYKYAFDPKYPDYKNEYLDFLQIGDKYNTFSDYNKFRADSMGNSSIRKKIPTMQYINAVISVARHSDLNGTSLLIDKSTDTMTIQQGISTGKYQYKELAAKPRWTMAPGDTIIEGYKCKKATTTLYGRDWIAWYSPDIDMPYGPYKFSGLPGLILYVADTESNFEFSFCGLARVNFYDPIYLCANRTLSTREDVRRMDKNFHADPAKALANSGFKVADEVQATVPAMPYNPIERE